MVSIRTFRVQPAAVALALLCTLLVGCQTTGNPREGGLFAWSEDKARQRHADLEAEHNDAIKTADAEQQRGAVLSNKQRQLQSEVSELRAHLARLIAENDELDGEVRELMSKRQLNAAEMSRLRRTLAASEQARADAKRAAAQASSPQAASQLSQHSGAVSHYNEQLHREVLLLMGR